MKKHPTKLPYLKYYETKRGGRSYVFYANKNGKTVEKVICRNVPYTDAAQIAQEELKKFYGVKARKGQLLFDEEAEKYFAVMAPTWKEKTKDQKFGLWRKHLKPYFGDMLPSEVTDAWPEYVTLKRSVKSTISLFNHRKLIKGILNFAHEAGRLERTPKIRNPDPKKKVGYVFKDEEISRLLGQAKSPMYEAIYISLKIGMRISELFSLEWDRINFHKGEIFLDEDHAKGGRARTVVFGPDVKGILQSLKKATESAYVFPSSRSDDKPWNEDYPGQLFRALKREVNIKRGRFHDLKHTAVTKMIIAGESLAAISLQVGTSVPELMRTYAHLLSQDIRSTASAVTFVGEDAYLEQSQGRDRGN